MNLFTFRTNSKKVIIEADTEDQARIIFQQRYGYWPDKAE